MNLIKCFCYATLAIFSFTSLNVDGLPAQNLDLQDLFPNQDQLPIPQLPNQLRPLPTIDPDLAGWNEAGQEADRVGSRIRSNWVMIGPTGEITGTVDSGSPADIGGMRIFALRDGIVVGQTTIDNFGDFRVGGMTEGSITIVGYSPNAFFAYRFNAVEYRLGTPYMIRHITTTTIAADNKKVVGKLIQENSPRVRFRSYGNYTFGEDDVSRASHFGWQGLAKFDVESVPATTIQARPITMLTNGRFRGRVHQTHNLSGRPVPIVQTEIKLIQNGRVVAETRCDRLGIFEFSGLASGNYGLVGVGSDGFAAIGIQLVSSRNLEVIPNRDTNTNATTTTYRTVAVSKTSKSNLEGNTVDLTLVQPESIGWINSYINQQHFAEVMAQPRPVARDNCPFCNPFLSYGGARACSCGR